MSTELSERTYVFTSRGHSADTGIDTDIDTDSNGDDDNYYPPFLQNHLHDTESLWWIMLWCFASFVPAGHIMKPGEHEDRVELYLKCSLTYVDSTTPLTIPTTRYSSEKHC
jgi:hypothetical protein